MKKSFLPIASILLSIVSSTTKAEDVTISPKNMLIFNNSDIKYNKNHFSQKEYDIGIKNEYVDKFDFSQLINLVYESKNKSDDEKFNYAIKSIYRNDKQVNVYDPFTINRLNKERDKYISIYNSAINEAKNIIFSIDNFIIQDKPFRYNISNNYDFGKEMLSFPHNSLFWGNTISLNDGSLNIFYVNENDKLFCEDCQYYAYIPVDIAEQIYNDKAIITLNFHLKSKKQLVEEITGKRILVDLNSIEATVIDNTTDYPKLLSRYSIGDISSKSNLKRNELYRTDVKVIYP